MNKLNAVEITVTVELNLNQSAAYLLCLSRVSAVKMKKEKSFASFARDLPLTCQWDWYQSAHDDSQMLQSMLPCAGSALFPLCCPCFCDSSGRLSLCSIPYLSLSVPALWPFPVLMCVSWWQLRTSLCQDFFFFCSVMMDKTWCSSALCCALLICTVNDTELVRVLRVLNWLVNNGNSY